MERYYDVQSLPRRCVCICRRTRNNAPSSWVGGQITSINTRVTVNPHGERSRASAAFLTVTVSSPPPLKNIRSSYLRRSGVHFSPSLKRAPFICGKEKETVASANVSLWKRYTYYIEIRKQHWERREREKEYIN